MTTTGEPGRLARLSLREKLGYGAGDFGFNLYWTTIASFLAAFYTEVFGLSAAAAGTMLFVTKLIDALTDPIMGAVADRTDSRYGKFRPYLLWAGVPMAGAAVLTFTTPDLDATGKLVWAYGSYIAMMLMYTVLSTPYSSLSGVMSARSQQRTELISFRFLFAFSGGAFVNKYTLPLVERLGQGDDAVGWQRTMLIYGIAACICFWISFASCRERVQAPQTEASHPLDDIRQLLNNRPWVVLFCLAMVIMITITLRAGSAYYFFHYYLMRPELLPDYLFWQMVAYAAGALATPLLTRFVEKTTLLKYLMMIVGVLSLGFLFVPTSQIELIFALNILISLALGPKSPLTWSMYADTADYNEWKNGRRATAMTFSAATFAQKLGGALASSTMLWILAALGYAAGQSQSDASQLGIAVIHTALPGVFALAAVVLVGFYNLSGNQLETIQQDLLERDGERDPAQAGLDP